MAAWPSHDSLQKLEVIFFYSAQHLLYITEQKGAEFGISLGYITKQGKDDDVSKNTNIDHFENSFPFG